MVQDPELTSNTLDKLLIECWVVVQDSHQDVRSGDDMRPRTCADVS